MDLPRFRPTVRRITILNRDETGQIVPVVVFDKARRKKKGTRALRPAERLARRLVEASAIVADNYLGTHKKANKKRRDGWLRDMNVNVIRAGRKGWKKLDPASLINP